MPRTKTIKSIRPQWHYFALLGLLLAGFNMQAHADTRTLEIYETYGLSHKIAAALSPLLEPGDKVQTYGNKLIIRASNNTHLKIIDFLKEIDRPPHMLLVSIRASDQSNTQSKSTEVSGELDSGNTSIRISTTERNDEVIVYRGSSTDGKVTMAVQAQDRKTTRDSNIIQQIRVMEGEAGFISVGESFPLHTLTLNQNSSQQTTEYHDISSGFHVSPILTKGQILVQIQQNGERRDEVLQRIVKTSKTLTTLRVTPSEWTPISSHQQGSKSGQTGIFYTTSATDRNGQGLEIRVDILD